MTRWRMVPADLDELTARIHDRLSKDGTTDCGGLCRKAARAVLETGTEPAEDTRCEKD